MFFSNLRKQSAKDKARLDEAVGKPPGEQAITQGRPSDVAVVKGPSKPPAEEADRTLRCRCEMKYLISEAKADAVAQYIKSFIKLDRYSRLRRTGSYPIVSLYLDSDDLRLCRESLTGKKNRFKLRIRGYTDEPDYPSFFEIKRRINTVILKARARVMHHDVQTLLAGLPLPPQNYHVDMETLNQFQLYMSSIQAKPMILIRYMRQAYEGGDDNRVRITFDRELCYKVTHRPEVMLGGGGWQYNSITLGGGVILEIKFTARFPAWISRMAAYFGLQQQSISKYATSITQACSLGYCAPYLEGVEYG